LDDAECGVLAGLYPGLKERYDALPLNVMRADICRVLAVYFFGGYYKDLDVDWRKPLREWVEPTDGIVYGWEDDEHVCQWFFAARPGDGCLRNILQQITNLIANTSNIDFNKNVEAVIDITGPGVWTDALQGCPFKPKYNYTYMRTLNVHHDYASAQWVGKDGYVSWLEERKKHAGWEEVWKEYNIHAFWLDDADKYTAPVENTTDMPVVDIASATQSSVLIFMFDLNGPQNAFDGSIETAAETAEDPHGWFEFTFAKPMFIGTLFGPPGPDHLSCVRVFNRHREVGSWLFVEPMEIELFNAAGHVVHNASKQGRITPFHTFHFGGMRTAVSRVRVKRKTAGAFTVSEIQIHSDPLCQVARATRLLSFTPKLDPTTHEAFKFATTLESPCPNSRALSVTMGFQYAHCGPLPSTREPDGCEAVVVAGHHHKSTIDAFALSEFAKANCTPRTVGQQRPQPSELRDGARLGRHYFTDWCKFNFGAADGAVCDPGQVYRGLTAYIPKVVVIRDTTGNSTTNGPTKTMVPSGPLPTRPDVLYLDMTTEEWRAFPSIVRLLDTVNATALFVPFRMTYDTLVHPNLLKNIAAIRARYAVHAFHLNPGEGLFGTTDGHAYPVELHLSLTRRAAP